jgi:transcriptional regulator with XRE-family HTH domain
MSELSNKIKAIRGQLNADEAGSKCGLSRESFYRIERGGSVKFQTLQAIATGFGLPESDWLNLLGSWLKHEAGVDAAKLFIEPREQAVSSLNDAESSQVGRAMMLFTDLNPHDRAEVLKAMQRPEVRACLPAINSVWEKFSS